MKTLPAHPSLYSERTGKQSHGYSITVFLALAVMTCTARWL